MFCAPRTGPYEVDQDREQLPVQEHDVSWAKTVAGFVSDAACTKLYDAAVPDDDDADDAAYDADVPARQGARPCTYGLPAKSNEAKPSHVGRCSFQIGK